MEEVRGSRVFSLGPEWMKMALRRWGTPNSCFRSHPPCPQHPMVPSLGLWALSPLT